MTASDKRVDSALAGMREALAEEEHKLEEAKAVWDASRERATRLRRAIEALDPPPREQKESKTKSVSNGNGKSAWTPSEEMRDRVLGVMKGRGKMGVVEIADAAGVSHETVRRTMTYARSQADPLVRLAGTGRNNAPLYEALNG